MPKKSVLLAMSGGIDSSAAAILLLRAGYSVQGVTLDMYETHPQKADSGINHEDKPTEAQSVAKQLGIKHHVVDVRKDFKKVVVDNFIQEYFDGRTPNPCVICNKYIKWDFLLNKADELGCDFIATGHYAQKQTAENGETELIKAEDHQKDQSYFLYRLNQKILKRAIFPLGQYKKEMLKEIVQQSNLHFLGEKKESMEICFIPHNNYRAFLLEENTDGMDKINAGDFVLSDGTYLGKHTGYPNYTIGQRKGLGVAVGYPLYVVEIKPETNTIVLGKREELYKKKLTATNLSFISSNVPDTPCHVTARVRYNHPGTDGILHISENKAEVRFNEPVFAITPGQSVVFYDNNKVLGGGLIE
jgi:tRNA-specific 2-thiouridylase